MADRFGLRDIQSNGVPLEGGVMSGPLSLDQGSRTTDTAPNEDLYLIGQSAYSDAAVNVNGGDIQLIPGQGRYQGTITGVAAGTITVIIYYLLKGTAAFANVTLTGSAAGPDWLFGANVTAAATNLVNAINTHATLSLYMTAYNTAGKVWLQRKQNSGCSALNFYMAAAGGAGVSSVTASSARVILGPTAFVDTTGGSGGPVFSGYDLNGSQLAGMTFASNRMVMYGTASTNLGGMVMGKYYVNRSSALTLTSTTYSNAMITNLTAVGQVIITLPTSIAGQAGQFDFSVQSANNFRILAPAGAQIRIGGAVSAAAGYVESNVIGNFLTLVQDGAGTTWYAKSVVGTWTVV